MADYLTTLGVKPVLGRSFTVEDDRPGGAAVALISHSLWQKHVGGKADIIGDTLNLEARTYTIIGVMPPGFDVPAAAATWVPMQINIASLPLTQRAVSSCEVVARLRPRISLKQAYAGA